MIPHSRRRLAAKQVRRAAPHVLIALMGAGLLVTLTACDESPVYSKEEALAAKVGIGTVAHVVRRQTHGTGSFTDDQPTLDILETGNIDAEAKLVQTKLRALGFTDLAAPGAWTKGTVSHSQEVDVELYARGTSFAFSDGKRYQLPAGGLVYAVRVLP